MTKHKHYAIIVSMKTPDFVTVLPGADVTNNHLHPMPSKHEHIRHTQDSAKDSVAELARVETSVTDRVIITGEVETRRLVTGTMTEFDGNSGIFDENSGRELTNWEFLETVARKQFGREAGIRLFTGDVFLTNEERESNLRKSTTDPSNYGRVAIRTIVVDTPTKQNSLH